MSKIIELLVKYINKNFPAPQPIRVKARVKKPWER